MKDYRLILKASVDAKSLDKEIQALSNKYKLNLKLNIDDKAVNDFTSKVNNIAKKNTKKITLIDPKDIVTLKQIEDRLNAIRAKGQGARVVTTSNGQGEVTGKLLQYRQGLQWTTAETYKLADATKKNGEFILTQTKNMDGSTRSLGHWTDGLSHAIQRTLQYATSIGLVYGALNQIKMGIQYIKDLNKEMTNIQVLQVSGAQTPAEINALALGYNRLAKEMGATTIEVAKGSTEWLRQGKTISETEELLRSSLMLAKLGNLETAEATDYLTSTLNSYKMGAEEAVDVVDKLIAVDNKAATSAGELATALKYSSSTAQQAGVSLDELISYIGTVSSVTRASAETIGQSFPERARGI